MEYNIAVLEGDGIGPKVIAEAVKVLKALKAISGVSFNFNYGLIGGRAWQETGSHLPDETLKLCEESQAVLLGAVGGPPEEMNKPKWQNCEVNSILKLRKHFKLHLNLRPIKLFTPLIETCILKSFYVEKGVDILCCRELSEGIYFGKKETTEIEGQKVAFDEMLYHEKTIEKIAHIVFNKARKRRKKVTSIDKANVLECSRLWREVLTRVSKEYPDCILEHLLIDHAPMQILLKSAYFDVIVCPNLFGDIISDELSILTGSLGLLSSASINENGFGVYESPTGSCYHLAAENIANPVGQILAAALLLKISLGLEKEHDRIIDAVTKVFEIKYRTPDLVFPYVRGVTRVTTEQMGDAICKFL